MLLNISFNREWLLIRQSVTITLYLVFVACAFIFPVAQKEGDRNSNNLYGLFDDALNNAGYITSWTVWLENILKGMFVALVKYHISCIMFVFVKLQATLPAIPLATDLFPAGNFPPAS